MKLNWGNWIAVAYSAFVLLIGFMVYMSFGQKWDLVAEDYYDQEIKFQEKIDSKTNVKEAGIIPQLSVKDQSIHLEFKSSSGDSSLYSGQVTFFRPSNAEDDVTFDFQQSNSAKFPLMALKKGKYLAKISWSDGEEGFYHEQTVILP